MSYPIELIHIDDKFIQRYSMVRIPYTKAGDHIFVVIAKENNYPLVTNDLGMTNVARGCDVQVFSPKEYSDILTNSA